MRHGGRLLGLHQLTERCDQLLTLDGDGVRLGRLTAARTHRHLRVDPRGPRLHLAAVRAQGRLHELLGHLEQSALRTLSDRQAEVAELEAKQLDDIWHLEVGKVNAASDAGSQALIHLEHGKHLLLIAGEDEEDLVLEDLLRKYVHNLVDALRVERARLVAETIRMMLCQ